MLTKEILQAIQLVDEHCHPDEAWEIMKELVDERTRQHSIKMLRKWEGNHSFDSAPFDKKIKEMKARCKELKNLMEEAKSRGSNIEIKATIEIKMVQRPFNNVVKLDITQN